MAPVSPSALRPTPDDGRRLSAEPVWDESDRPQVAEPTGVSGSARGLAAAQSLLDVHAELREQLTQIRALVHDVASERIEPGDARAQLSQMSLREHDWGVGAYCQSYCRLVAQHHFGEDLEIFPHLRQRAGADLDPVLDRLEQEHVVIHGLLDRVDLALVSLVGDGDRTRLSAVTDQLTDALLSHLAYEERELLAPMARVFG